MICLPCNRPLRSSSRLPARPTRSTLFRSTFLPACRSTSSMLKSDRPLNVACILKFVTRRGSEVSRENMEIVWGNKMYLDDGLRTSSRKELWLWGLIGNENLLPLRSYFYFICARGCMYLFSLSPPLHHISQFTDQSARRHLISNAQSLVRVSRGKNIIISSEAQRAMELRGPYDLVNL